MAAHDLDELIGDLHKRPPAPARSIDDVVRAASRIRLARRRRRVLGAGGLLVLVIVGAVVVVDRGEDSVELNVGASITTRSDEVPPPSSRGAELRIDTSADLSDGQLVTVTGGGFPAGQEITMSICEKGVTSQTASSLCEVNALHTAPADSAGRIRTSYKLRRVIQTTNGVIDCAEAPGRCVLGAARLESSQPVGPLATLPLRFDPEGPGGIEERFPTRPGDLVQVRVGRHGNTDRVVFEFAGPLPEQRDVVAAGGPLESDCSHRGMPGVAFVIVVVGANTLPTSNGLPVSVPSVVRVPGDGPVLEVRLCGFEGRAYATIALSERSDPQVSTLTDPSRLVIDLTSQ